MEARVLVGAAVLVQLLLVDLRAHLNVLLVVVELLAQTLRADRLAVEPVLGVVQLFVLAHVERNVLAIALLLVRVVRAEQLVVGLAEPVRVLEPAVHHALYHVLQQLVLGEFVEARVVESVLDVAERVLEHVLQIVLQRAI